MIDLEFLEKVVDILSRSNAEMIEIRKRLWGTSVKIAKNSGAPASGVGRNLAPAQAATVPLEMVEPAAQEEESESEREDVRIANLIEIKSPMVGTFYAQPEPGAEPYVQVGSRIEIGEPLCIIEAMKIMNPIDAEVAGVIREVSVDDVQPVEFGQVLFRVDPNG